MPNQQTKMKSVKNPKAQNARDTKEKSDTASTQDQADAMSSTERTNKRNKYISHNITVLTICCCCAMLTKYINVEDHACRFSVVCNLVAVHNTLQGSEARDRVAILKNAGQART